MDVRQINERQQIQICRVLCIFFMMSVHVNPGISKDSLISTGELFWLGEIWCNFLGRASVAALSLVSGYLLIRTASSTPISSLARRRFSTLIVPMLTWNLIFCGMLMVKSRVLHLESPGAHAFSTPDANLLNQLTGLAGPTANLSLFFLRDLFVSVLLVHMISPWLDRWPAVLIGATGVVTIFHLSEPLVIRPSILFFVVAGAVYANRSSTLAGPLAPRRVVGVTTLLVGCLVLLQALSLENVGPVAEANDLLRRCLLVVVVLVVSAAITGTRVGGWLVPLERRIFETYLLHVPLISVLWVPWRAFVGEAEDPSYLLFFLSMPVLAMFAGAALGRLCDRMAYPVQKLLRGKTSERAAGADRPSAPGPASPDDSGPGPGADRLPRHPVVER